MFQSPREKNSILLLGWLSKVYKVYRAMIFRKNLSYIIYRSNRTEYTFRKKTE